MCAVLTREIPCRFLGVSFFRPLTTNNQPTGVQSQLYLFVIVRKSPTKLDICPTTPSRCLVNFDTGTIKTEDWKAIETSLVLMGNRYYGPRSRKPRTNRARSTKSATPYGVALYLNPLHLRLSLTSYQRCRDPPTHFSTKTRKNRQLKAYMHICSKPENTFFSITFNSSFNSYSKM